MKSVVSALTTMLVLAACQKSEHKAPPPAQPPSPELIRAMREYCRIETLPADKQHDAFKAWGWQNGGDKDVNTIWMRAAKGDAPSIAVVRAAADAALGAGNCKLLDALKAKP